MWFNRDKRVWELDLLRGLLVMVMTMGHAIHFLHNGSSPALAGIGWVANLVSFTGFILVSGAVHKISGMRRTFSRSVIYLLSYYLLAGWVVWVKEYHRAALIGLPDWQGFGRDWMQIVIFRQLAPFTEFLAPLIFLGLLSRWLRRILDGVSRSLSLSLLLGAGFYILGTGLFATNTSGIIPEGWKAIIAGSAGWYSFPLLQYLPVYLIGMWVGGNLPEKIQLSSRKKLTYALGSLTAIMAIVSLNLIRGNEPGQIFNRWPPSPAFLLAGTGLVLPVLIGLRKLENLRNFPWTRTWLLLLGQNALAVFLVHTFLLYAYQAMTDLRVSSVWLVGAFWFISLCVSLYWARWLPFNFKIGLTLVNWCECHWSGACAHARENRLIRLVKRFLVKAVRIDDLMSVKIGGRRLRLFKKRQVLLGMAMVLASVTALGVADNYQLINREVLGLKGKIDREWILVTDDDQNFEYLLELPAELNPQKVRITLTGQNSLVNYQFKADKVIKENDVQSWQVGIPRLNLEPGIYELRAELSYYGFSFQTDKTEIKVSHPLYVTWTIDWEGYDAADQYMEALAGIAEDYGVKMTQMWNPRIYVTSYYPMEEPENQVGSPFNDSTALIDVTSVERAKYLTEWVKFRKEKFGDEIGLHLHMFPDAVRDAGVEPKNEPTWGGGWSHGYDVLTTAYSKEELGEILYRAKGWFVSQDLGMPKSFRAGAWFANLDTLRALEAADFLVDSSGRTAYTFGTKSVPGFWDLSPTSQPYFPSTENQNSDLPGPNLRVLEIPNNGADSFAFLGEEMIARFDANYEGQLLIKPAQVTFLSHPHWFNSDRQNKMRQVFEYIRQFEYRLGRGPVVYATLREVYDGFISRSEIFKKL